MGDERPDRTDPEAWIDEHGDVLFRFALARVRRPDLAEELVQETLLSAYRSRGTFEGRSQVQTWLVQILRNKIVDHFRKRRETPASELAGEDESIEDLFDRKGRWNRKPAAWDIDPGRLLESREFLGVLESCLGELPGRQAEVFTLRVMDAVSGTEVCKLLDLTATNVGVLLHRARMRLRRCLEANWFEIEDGSDG